MSKTTVHCPTCKRPYLVAYILLTKGLSCKHCKKVFRLEKIDDYVMIRSLGEGAFGIVQLAYDTRLKREVAIKQLKELAIPEHEIESFVKRAIIEAEALAKIKFHPNIMPLYNTGHQGNKFYIVTPVIEGTTLDELIPEKGYSDPLHAVGLTVTLLKALHHVHAFNIFHRDVKPGNIMIDENGNLLLVDFGLAACQQLDVSTWTEMGTVMGTPAFMPPEQALGEINRVGSWSDQYSAAVVLYKLLTGNVPYPGKGYMVLSAVGDPKKLPIPPRHFRPDLDPKLERLILKAMSKFPGDRFESCLAFANSLTDWSKTAKKPEKVIVAQLDELPVPKRKQETPSPKKKPTERIDEITETSRTWLWVLLACLLLAGLGVGGYFVFQALDKDKSPSTPTKKPKIEFDDFTH